MVLQVLGKLGLPHATPLVLSPDYCASRKSGITATPYQ
jgi:hypothetical protein